MILTEYIMCCNTETLKQYNSVTYFISLQYHQRNISKKIVIKLFSSEGVNRDT